MDGDPLPCYDEEHGYIPCLQHRPRHCSSSSSLLSVLLELGVDFLDTALPPHNLFAGVLVTALLPPIGDGSSGLHLVTPEW